MVVSHYNIRYHKLTSLYTDAAGTGMVLLSLIFLKAAPLLAKNRKLV